MLSIRETTTRLCQGMTRRQWLRVGGLSSVGLMLPELLRTRAAAAKPPSGGTFGRARSCIVCFMFGAQAHQDIWDLKPDASDEVRGPFNPISSRVPGTQLSELIPRTAAIADKFALVRSVTHPDSTHTVAQHYMMTGYRHRRPNTNPTNLPDDFPCFGAVMQKLRPSQTAIPSGISLNAPGNEIPSGHIFPGFFAGFIGNNYDPMFISDDPSGAAFAPIPTSGDVTRGRMQQRQSLLDELDAFRRKYDFHDSIRATDSFHQKALSLINSPSAARAFDLQQELPTTRDRYGHTSFGQGCLLARRLVEADVRLVTVNWARDYHASENDHWDTHSDNFGKLRRHLVPNFDQGFSALIADLDQRGLLEETLVVMMDEFGRSPKINKNGGRDHWPGCNSIVLAGAGIRGGTLYGASDSMAAYPSRDAVCPEDVAATIYHALGIPLHTQLVDHSGRPHPLNTGKPIDALFG
jgi:hypothetical protein